MTTALALAPKATTRLFLGVERSVCGRAWRDRLDERATARALAIAQRHNVPELLARIPLGRVAEPSDIVGASLFFCSKASDFVTGQVLYLDGGITASQ